MNPRDEMTQAEFILELDAYLEANPKIKSLYDKVGSFDDLPKNIKNIICAALRIELIEIINRLPPYPVS